MPPLAAIWEADTSPEFRRFRWVAVVIYALSVMSMACISFSWQQYSMLLIEGGAYKWLCVDEDWSIDREFGSGALCLAQEKAVGDLFSLLSIMQAISGLLAGITIDHVGRRICALFGCALAAASIGLLLIAGEQHHTAYLWSIILDGLSCNLVAFPALVLADMFPSHPVAATAVMMTSEFLGAIIPPILWAAWSANRSWTFQNIWTVYLCAVMAPLSLLYVITIAPSSFAMRKAEEEKARRANLLLMDQTRIPPTTSLSSIPTRLTPLPTAEPEPSVSIPAVPTSVSLDMAQSSGLPTSKTAGGLGVRLKQFVRELLTKDFIVFDIVFNLFMLKHTFYPAVLRDMSGTEISTYQGYFQTTQCVWALSIGALCDYCCTATAAFCITLCDLFVFGMAMVPQQNVQYVTATVFTIIHSYVYTIRFTFVRESFTPDNRGKILGVIGLLSAATNLLNIPINRTTQYRLWCALMAGFTLCQWPFLYALKHRFNKYFRAISPPKTFGSWGKGKGK